MPIRKRNKKNRKYLIWAIIILIVALMVISMPNNPVFTEVVLFP